MTEADILRASPAKLAELARFYGLRQVGEKRLWWVRKSATHPHTRRQHYFQWSTQTADLRTALARAIPRVEDFLARVQTHLEAPVRPAARGLTLAKLEDAYLAAPTVRASAATRKRNWADLERIVRLVHGADLDLANAEIGLVSLGLAKDYQRLRLVAVEAAAKGNKLELEAGKRAINSTLAHAQSVFSREAMQDYHSLRLPAGVLEFANAAPVAARRQEEPVPLGDEFVAGLLRAVSDLKAADPAAWAAFALMLWGGLRNVDAYHARRSWLVKEAEGYRLRLVPTEDYTPKGRSGSVILPASVVEELLALPAPTAKVVELPAEGKPEDPHLVPAATKTARHDACYRAVNAWLRKQGVGEEAGKLAYRLRKYFLAKVAEQQGRMMAQIAARHADGATTEAHYIGAPKMQKPIAL